MVARTLGPIAQARLLAEHSRAPVYEYLYSHEGSTSLTDLFLLPNWKLGIKAAGRLVGLDMFSAGEHKLGGVCHGDELFLLFRPHLLPYDAVHTDADEEASANLVELWTNFAATGKPTPNGAKVRWDRSVVDIRKKLLFSHTRDEEIRSRLWAPPKKQQK